MNITLKRGWKKLEGTKESYYSHLYFPGEPTMLPVYEYEKALTSTGLHRLVINRTFVRFDSADEMAEYIERHPELQEADKKAWDTANWIPDHLQAWLQEEIG